MAYFPRKGTELSANAEVRFLEGSNDRPAVVHRMEDGWREGRFLSEGSTHPFTVVFRGPKADFDVMDAFFESHGTVVEFDVVHPDLGTGTGYLTQTRHSFRKIVSGNPAWFEMEIPIEGTF